MRENNNCKFVWFFEKFKKKSPLFKITVNNVRKRKMCSKKKYSPGIFFLI